MPKLLINEGGQASVFELFDDEATIGRGASNSIQIVDAHASKHHAVVRRLGGRVKLVELESKNGTRVNGEFRNQRWLQHGDAISIGAAVLTYDASDGAAAADVPAQAAAFVGARAAASAAAGAVAAPVSRAAAPRSRRDRERDEDEDGDGRPRRSSRRSSNSTGVALLVGAGLIGVVVIFFLILGGKGNPPNTMALARARQLSMLGGKDNVQAALDYLTQYGDPSDVDTYRSIITEIEGLKNKLIAFDETDVEEAALKEYNAIERAFIEMHKNGRTPEAIGADLMKWVAKYTDVVIPGEASKRPRRAVAGFLAGYKNPNLLNLYKKTKDGGSAPK